ncbi:MAG: hypothetical protein R3344_09945, partial [Acidobacteriota bacterium]|nr:hypothetical protein [Acidobacteriota bacterium]
YDRESLELDALVEQARARGVADAVYPPKAIAEGYRVADDADQKRQIRGSVFDGLRLSPMQRTKVNAFATGDLQRALAWLTPAQRAEFDRRVAARR